MIHGQDFDALDKDIKLLYYKKKKARDQFLATAFLLGGNRTKYCQLVANLQNSYILGVDQYPKDVEECYDMMLGYSKVIGTSPSNSKEIKDLYTTSMSFYQSSTSKNSDVQTIQSDDEVIPGLSGKVFKDVLCYSCNKKGNYANDCPTMDQTTNSNTNKGFCMAQFDFTLTQLKAKLKPTWILLDTQSSCDIFNNKDLLENIICNNQPSLKLYSNRNLFIKTNMKGTVRGYGSVWFHPDSLANILSFSNIKKNFK